MTSTELSEKEAKRTAEEYRTNLILDSYDLIEKIMHSGISSAGYKLLLSVENILQSILDDNHEVSEKVRFQRHLQKNPPSKWKLSEGLMKTPKMVIRD